MLRAFGHPVATFCDMLGIENLKSWFSKGGLLVLDDLLAEGGDDKELLDLFTKHSYHQNITVFTLFQDIPSAARQATSLTNFRRLLINSDTAFMYNRL